MGNKLISRLGLLRALGFALLMSGGCVSAEEEDDVDDADTDTETRVGLVRGCTGCTWKTASFTAVPTTSIDTASLKVAVTHAGACPQGQYVNNCTETLTYDVKCALGSSTITLPMLIDASTSSTARTATLAVKQVGGTTQYITGTVASGAGTTTMPATPCAPPTVDPYVTLPTVL